MINNSEEVDNTTEKDYKIVFWGGVLLCLSTLPGCTSALAAEDLPPQIPYEHDGELSVTVPYGCVNPVIVEGYSKRYQDGEELTPDTIDRLKEGTNISLTCNGDPATKFNNVRIHDAKPPIKVRTHREKHKR